MEQDLAREVAETSWTDTGYVFTNNLGGSLDDSKLRKRYRKFLAVHGIRYIRIHDIRHTFATIVIEDDSGQLASVSRALGHSTIGITMDIYAKTARIETHATSRMTEIMFPDRGKVAPIEVRAPRMVSLIPPGRRRAT
jgi:integrase